MLDLRGKTEYYLQVLVGAAVAFVVFWIVSKVGGSVLSWQTAANSYGASPESVGEAWQEAVIEIIGAFAALGAAVILSVQGIVVERIKAWWSKK